MSVSTETVLQVVKFYNIVKKNRDKLTFQTVVLRWSDYSLKSQFFKIFFTML